MTSHRLLILACSQRKDPSALPLTALERYNGPTYQVVRRYARQHENSPLPLTFSLSAEFGLIPSDTLVPLYDRRMTPHRATQLLPAVEQSLQHLATTGRITDVLICAGRDYLAALTDVGRILTCPSITYASGSLGRQVTMLHSWLRDTEGQPAPAKTTPKAAPSVNFKGNLIAHTPKQILRLADVKALADPVGAGRYEGWFVQTKHTRVAPKWLVCALTGVPVGKFRTADAVSLLTKLGILVSKKY